MTQGCTCCTHDRGTEALLTTISKPARVKATDVVAELGRRSPVALEVMKDLGINHCCGGHLELSEAAAAAGVPLDTLIARLDAALATDAGR